MKKLAKKIDLLALIGTAIFLMLLIVVPNVKVFFVLAFVYFGFLIFNYSFAKALIYSAPVLSYINLGQVHSILVIEAKNISAGQYLEGRQLNWSITPYLIISLIAFLMFKFWQKKLKQKFKLLLHEKITIILIGWGFLSAIYGSLMPSLSIYYMATSLIGITWIAYLILIGQNSTKKEWSKIIHSILLTLIMLIIYESIIVFGQMFFGRPLGLSIETTKMAPMFGLGTDEAGGSFRPFGLSYHPNGLANQQLILLSSVLFLSSYLNNKNELLKKIISLTAILSLIVIILSLSRAAFLAILVALIIMIIRQPKYFGIWKNSIKNNLNKFKLWHKIIIILLISTLIFKLTDRLLNSVYSFSENGGVNTRLTEYEEALLVFSKSPIFGVGDQMFIPTSYQLFPKGIMSYFPENVHNGYLLLMTERGIVGITLYLIFILIFIKGISQSKLTKETKTMLYSGLSTGLIMMTLHPERNFFSLIVLFGMVILHYEKNIKKNIV